jgi:Ion channel
MTQVLRIPILIPLAVGALVILCTIFIHAMSVAVSLKLLRRERRLGRTGRSFWSDFPVVVLAMLATLVAHLIEIALWAEVFVLCGEFPYFGTAYYHSAVNYTTLGYGDLVMTPHWRFLGPLEAANGMLLFGVSTAMVFALIQWLIEARFADLRD